MDIKLYSPKTIKDIKDMFNFSLSKGLGQNFLTDKNIIDSIIEKSDIGRDDLVIEIGPGIGVITRELSQIAKRVVAIEIDTRLIPILNYTLGDCNNIDVINEDILKVDINKLIYDMNKKYNFDKVRIVGNLPYYITTPIIMHLLESELDIASITVMMQKEVGDRLTACAGSKNRGAISAVVEYYCDAYSIVKVPKSVFVPVPKVDSVVLKMDIREEKPVFTKDKDLFFKIIKSGFLQRRKTLLNSLSQGLKKDKGNIKKILELSKIDSNRRAETLTLEEFSEISNQIYEMEIDGI